MVARTIRHGAASYVDINGQTAFALHGAEVDVHEDDVERFDGRVSQDFPEAAPVDGAEVDVHEEIEIPDGDPTTDWSGKQLDKYAAEFGIDLSAAKNKTEKVAAIAAASASA